MAEVELVRLSKTYADGTVAVRDLDLSVADGEFMVLVGPSGCGKTTALRMVAGLEEPSGGEIRIGGRAVERQPPKDRDIAMVFQSYALYPHLSVAANIGFGLALRKMPKAEIRSRVADTARMLGLEELLDKKPRHLSGGQRQRVAMGRAIVRRPRAFLMDEPLSNLDAKLRVQMRAEIAALQRDLGVTTVYVTHDQVEAMTMGHRVAVMRRGVLQQVDNPQALYDRPVNLFVAGFVGSPAMNLLEARVDADGDGAALRLGSQTLQLGADDLHHRPALNRSLGRTLAVGIRPEDMEDAALAGAATAGRILRSTARLVEALGKEKLVHFSIDASAVLTDDAREMVTEAGPGAAADLVASVSARSPVADGDEIALAVDTGRLHFFDLDDGTRIDDEEAGTP